MTELSIREMERTPIDDLIDHLDREGCLDESYVAAKRMQELLDVARIMFAQCTSYSGNENIYDDASKKVISVIQARKILGLYKETPVTCDDLNSILANHKCPECGGLGTCDDLEPGDIGGNTWTCPKCQGTGLLNGKSPFIVLTAHELQSGLSRVGNAEGLIAQLPPSHGGRNTWLMNYGTRGEAESLRQKNEPYEVEWNSLTQAARVKTTSPSTS